jgi:hypothetical protein
MRPHRRLLRHPSAPSGGLLPPSPATPSAGAFTNAADDKEDEEELGPRTQPHASSPPPPSAAAASMGLRLSAAALAAAALTSRRSDSANRGRMMVKRSPGAAKSTILAPPPTGSAPLVGTSSGQLPVLLEHVEDPRTAQRSATIDKLVSRFLSHEQIVHVLCLEELPVAVDATAGAGGLARQTVEEHPEMVQEPRSGHARGPASARNLAFKRWARGRCFRCLARDHLVRDCRESFRCIGCLRLGHRERDCWHRPSMAEAPPCDL